MRPLLALLVFGMLPAAAAAQMATPPASPPMPSIGLPLPPIGLPLPAIGLDSARDPLFPEVLVPSQDGRRHPRRPPPAILIFGAPYAFGIDPALQSNMPGYIAPAPAPPAPPTTGTLRLHVEPFDTLQVFVDGEYVGTPNDFEGELELPAGTRQVELRAPGYETVRFDVRILAGRAISYRGSLEPVKERQPEPPDQVSTPPAGPTSPKTTFYLIPGCYIGNVPPEEVKLPPGCDVSRLITHTPGTP